MTLTAEKVIFSSAMTRSMCDSVGNETALSFEVVCAGLGMSVSSTVVARVEIDVSDSSARFSPWCRFNTWSDEAVASGEARGAGFEGWPIVPSAEVLFLYILRMKQQVYHIPLISKSRSRNIILILLNWSDSVMRGVKNIITLITCPYSHRLSSLFSKE